MLTGTYLALFYEPSTAPTTYEGSYEPLIGVEMSRAYRSAVELSWDVRAGLVMRQIHHWAALVFVAAIVAHLCRNFFTGAFRRPRELNWLVGVTLLILAIVNGFAGYSLLDDLLSGTGLRIAYSIALSVPVIGTWLAFLAFGGEFPADDIMSRLFVIHIFIVPAAIVVLLGLHIALVWRQRHTQFAGPGRSEHNVVGTRFWPAYAAKSVGLFALVSAVLAGLGGLVQINPVWLHGPYDPSAVTTAAQPDWYMGWIEGAMRLAGPWAWEFGPFTLSELFVPAILLPAATFGVLYAWPFIERRLTGDRDRHQLLERPRDRPGRTAFGCGALAFYTVLFVAGSQDIIAAKLEASQSSVLLTLQVLVFVLPVAVAGFSYRLASDLRRGSRAEPNGYRPAVTEHAGVPSDNTTLTAVLQEFEADGFIGQFEAASETAITCVTCGSSSPAIEYEVHGRRRLEGASDPDDMLSIVAVTCPRCNARGTLVLGFGPNASDTETAIGMRLRDRRGGATEP